MLLLLQLLPEVDGVGEIGIVVRAYGRTPFSVFGNNRVGLFRAQPKRPSERKASLRTVPSNSRLQIRDWGTAN
jgi:hypothetical protein